MARKCPGCGSDQVETKTTSKKQQIWKCKCGEWGYIPKAKQGAPTTHDDSSDPKEEARQTEGQHEPQAPPATTTPTDPPAPEPEPRAERRKSEQRGALAWYDRPISGFIGRDRRAGDRRGNRGL